MNTTRAQRAVPNSTDFSMNLIQLRRPKKKKGNFNSLGITGRVGGGALLTTVWESSDCFNNNQIKMH